MTSFSIDFAAAVHRHEDELIDLRRHLHAHPELSRQETATTALIHAQMAALGAERLACPTETGAVYALGGGRPGRTVLLRGDIDALPVDEAADVPYRSLTPGVMHACGHDAHAAGLIGTAHAVADHLDDLPGRYVFLFQPAEEALDGARSMIEGGVLNGLGASAVLGWHAASPAPTGMVGVRAGVTMARAQELVIHAHGRGGHGALQGSTGNPLLAVAAISQRLQGLVADQSYEGVTCACSAGVLRAGTAANVIPTDAHLSGTLRTFTPEHLEAFRSRLDVTLAEVAEEQGVELEARFGSTAEAVVNDAAITDVVRQSARRVLADDLVLEMPPVTPSEDFSEFLAHLPGCFFFVGAGLADGSSGSHHEAAFAIDDRCVAIGASVLATAAVHLAAG